MEIKKKKEGEKLTISLHGNLDAGSAPSFLENASKEIVGTKELILDFAHLDYVSSAGLRAILMMDKRMLAQGGAMRLIHVNDNVMETLSLTGFTNILTIL